MLLIIISIKKNELGKPVRFSIGRVCTAQKSTKIKLMYRLLLSVFFFFFLGKLLAIQENVLNKLPPSGNPRYSEVQREKNAVVKNFS